MEKKIEPAKPGQEIKDPNEKKEELPQKEKKEQGESFEEILEKEKKRQAITCQIFKLQEQNELNKYSDLLPLFKQIFPETKFI